MKKLMRLRTLLAVLIVAAICGLIWWFTKPAEITGMPMGKSGAVYGVKVGNAQIKNMPVTIQEMGNVEAEESVNIIAQASGALRKINITQGQMVQAGQLLFEVEPAVYSANVAQAQANLSRDLAQLAFLKATANRYQALAKLEYITMQQYDQAEAAVKEQEAVVAADQAQLEQQKIQLSYTQIRSPISGRAGAISVHVGDLITANSPTPLVVVNRVENVLINFNIPQDRLGDLLNYQRAGTLKLTVWNESGDRQLAQGELVFVGNIISGQTGTVQLKGKVANADAKLWPGQLVTVRLILTMQPKALVVPSTAVQLGQKGNYVYVVKNDKAVIQPVTIDREVGYETIIAKGLQTSDQLITEIPPGLQDGSKVRIAGQT
jgi:RND family efflux transporter MFP subunit